jgi:hypothetical protein
VYGTEVSKQTISTIADKVMYDVAEWQKRPLDAVYRLVADVRGGQVQADREIVGVDDELDEARQQALAQGQHVPAEHQHGPVLGEGRQAGVPQMMGMRLAGIGGLTWAYTGERGGRSCYYRHPASKSVRDGGEVEEAGWFGQVERGQDGALARGGQAALGDAAVGGGQGDQVHAVQLVSGVAPGVAGGVLDDPDE